MKHNVDYDEKRHAYKYFSKSPFTVLICIKMVKATFSAWLRLIDPRLEPVCVTLMQFIHGRGHGVGGVMVGLNQFG